MDIENNNSAHPQDHRDIAQQLDLLHFQDEAPGMVFWHPRGWSLYQLLEGAARRAIARQGYEEVRSPQVVRAPIWESSGHAENFAHAMFHLQDEDGRAASLKPVSCPCHIQIAKHRPSLLSYRDLPLRMAEFGLCHRNERSGSLRGLFRLRQFSQDDGHIFCEPEQVEDEIARFCRDVVAFYAGFGFERVGVKLSGRPKDFVGDDARWAWAEAALDAGARAAGMEPESQAGEGAFYGPKLEMSLEDHQGRWWQCGTIQLDVAMPERFGLQYVDRDNSKRHPAMLHRAMYGSIERFMGVLLEHHGARLPAWLAPEQVRLLIVQDDQRGYAEEVKAMLEARGIRVGLDSPRDEHERLARRIARAHEDAIPVQCVLGRREAERRVLNLRHVSGDDVQRALPLEEGVAHLEALCKAPL